MLIDIGKQGRVARQASAALTSGFSLERFQVLNRSGVAKTVELGAATISGAFIVVKRWAENAANAHFLLTPGYIAGSLDVANASGSVFTLPEPVEVSNVSGQHFYIENSALTLDRNLVQIVN